VRPDAQDRGWRRGRDPDPDGVALAAAVAAGVLLGARSAAAAGTHAGALAALTALLAAALAGTLLGVRPAHSGASGTTGRGAAGGRGLAARPVRTGALVLVTLALTGAAVAAMRVAGAAGGLLPRLAAAEPGVAVTVTGTVAEEPRPVRFGGRLVTLRVERVLAARHAWRTQERAAVVFGRDTRPPAEQLVVGARLRLHAGVALAAHPGPEPAARPGGDRSPAAAAGVGRTTASLGLSDQPPVILRRPWLEAYAPPTSLLLRASEAVRAAARGSARASLPPEPAGLLVGMALGDTSLLSPAGARAFKDAGLSHLLAASGENLAVLLAAGLGLAVALGADRPLLAAIGGLLTGAFALLTRWEPSVLRASVMAVLVLAGVATGRGPGGRRALCLAVTFLLLASPSLAGTLGFQLSVAATAGVLWLGPPLARLLPRWLPWPVRSAVGFTLGAQAAALPAVALALGQLSLAGLPANLLALPLATPPMLLGVVAALTAPTLAPLASIACHLAAPFLAALLAVAQAAAHLPGGTIALHGPTRLLPALSVLAGGAAARRWRREPVLDRGPPDGSG
jgi:competence protein ComEC